MRMLLALVALAGCGGATPKPAAKPEPLTLDLEEPWADPLPEVPAWTPRPRAGHRAALANPRATPIAIVHATILPADGPRIEDGAIVLEGGAIRALGPAASVAIPTGARVVDGRGKFVTPGLIDAHSHLGVYSAPGGAGHQDGNEATAPVTAGVEAQFAYWPQDPQIARASAGGVTAALILPGSANIVGGRGFIVAMRQARVTSEVAFPGAPATVKMACGENPKRVYGGKGGPSTRMGEYAAFRVAFHEARAYVSKHATYRRVRALWEQKRTRAAELEAQFPRRPKVKPEPAPEPPAVDLKLETLAGVLRGEVLVQVHCYKASDMGEMMAIADEFGFKIRSFHHALEAYKIRDLLVAKGIAVNTWSDWWGFKLEAYDGIEENAALFEEQGGKVTIHSDSPIGIQRLNQDAAKAMAAGRAAGVALTEDQALRWVTANPAWVLGIDDVTGTLAVGKRADVTVWSASPLSVYARAELTIAGGEITFERATGLQPADFELGTTSVDAKVTR
jgi:imidazolonepropionase-like amidohydrolase